MDKRLRILLIVTFLFALMLTVSCSGDNPASLDDSSDSETTLADDRAVPVFQQDTAPESENKYEQITYVGDNIPVSRALVAKMLAYIDNDAVSIDSMERVIEFKDTKAEDWYDRYINAVITQGYMSGGGDSFMPDMPLTISHAQLLLDKIDPGNKVKIQITPENKDKAISYALWTDLYYKLLTNLSGEKGVSERFGIIKLSVIPLATPGNNSKLKNWNMITSTGPLSYKGLNMDDYIDKKISVLKKDNEIIAFLGITDYAPIIKNAYLVGNSGTSITIFAGGTERTYSYNASKIDKGQICDVKINGSNAEKVTVYNEKTGGVIKRIDTNIVELEDKGEIEFTEDTRVYSTADGNPKLKTVSNVTVGTDIAEFYTHNGKVIAVIITKSVSPVSMRIALNTTGFNGLIHKSVSLTANSGYSVKTGDKIKNYAAGDLFSIGESNISDVFKGGINRIYIETANESAKIQINSIKRNWADGESPKYRGKLEISLENGGMVIVNELPFEEYLYAVIPSEMPSGHGLEAAKIQAVTARSYAYNQYYSNRFSKYGANIDDSVNSQVYNNTPETDISVSAANQTSGQCLTYNGSVISANFFSTSSGMTANSGEVWSSSATKLFPHDSEPYLTSSKQYTSGDYGDLKLEENARKFFKDMSVSGYDSSFAWFRWNVEMTADEIAASINSAIKSRYEANPKLILTLDENAVYRSLPIESVGSLKDIEILERGEGGNITKLKITGSNATVLVMTEYNIRMLLKPMKILDGGRDIEITRKDGTKTTNYSLLPSAFFVIDKTLNDDGSLSKILFSGGGNGHGVGMSQNGAKGMIDAGYKFDEILKHYYKGTEVKKMI